MTERRTSKRGRSSSDDDTPMGACSACKEPIRRGATKCIHCQSYQGIWRPLGVSSVVLSLLVALIAVIGSTAGALKSVLHTPSAHIGFAIQGAVAHQIAVLVYNDGDRLATLSGGALSLPDGRQVFVAPAESAGPMLLPAHSSQLLHFMTLDPTGRPPAAKQQCKFGVLIGDEHGGREINEHAVPCDDVSGFFN